MRTVEINGKSVPFARYMVEVVIHDRESDRTDFYETIDTDSPEVVASIMRKATDYAREDR